MTEPTRRRSAAPQSPDEDERPLVSHVESATEPKATEAYNLAQSKPPASDIAGRDSVRYFKGAGPDADEFSLDDLVGQAGGSNVMSAPHDVYEVFPAPGAPDRVVRRLAYHKGQNVPVAALKANAERARQAKSYNPISETK